MYVVGHGIDLVAVVRLQQYLDDPRNPLLARCFTASELAECGKAQNQAECLAGRFAAKEAVVKALGTGFGDGVAYTDVTIVRAPGKAPEVRLSAGAARAAASLGISGWQVSIAHEAGLAIASALAIGSSD